MPVPIRQLAADTPCRMKLSPGLLNGLGKIQRAVLGYLSMAPEGFAGKAAYDGNRMILRHGLPRAVTVREIANGIYEGHVTPSRLRMVQHAVQRLERLGLVMSVRVETGSSTREVVTKSGEVVRVTRPVTAKAAVIRRWDCKHTA